MLQSREARYRMMAKYPHIPHDSVEALREKRTDPSSNAWRDHSDAPES
jgi:hypothetical protein